MLQRCATLYQSLMNNTVLADFFQPASSALERVRYSESRFQSLSMEAFCLFGCLRHLQGINTLREQIQQLFHFTDAACMPVARSTYSDALNSISRQTIVQQAVVQLIRYARERLPDRLCKFEELQGRPVYAVDGSYQRESTHFDRTPPKQGGNDNPKGHMMLTFFDIRLGAPVGVQIETRNTHEMMVFKACGEAPDSLLRRRRGLWVVDRAYVDMPFWDLQHARYQQTVITRMKDNLVVESARARHWVNDSINAGVMSDEIISLKASRADWRRIEYHSPEGTEFVFLTNEMNLAPGVIAFLYLRRWDEEKCFDTWKNDFSSDKAWSKSVTGITTQAWLAIMTSLLLLLFIHAHQARWKMGDEKSLRKQENRMDRQCVVKEQRIPWYTFYYRAVSKVSRQVIRFLKHCFAKKSSDRLYEQQLRPLLVAYL